MPQSWRRHCVRWRLAGSRGGVGKTRGREELTSGWATSSGESRSVGRGSSIGSLRLLDREHEAVIGVGDVIGGKLYDNVAMNNNA